ASAFSLTLHLPAQPVTWNRQAFGQTNICVHDGTQVSYFWPNDNNWSQALALGDPCSNGQSLEVAPSNWSTPNPPTNSTDDVVIGTQGGPANLDLQVSINSLTLQAGGALNFQASSVLGAHAYSFQADGGIAQGGGGGAGPLLLVFSGGTMNKSGGTGTFTIDPGLAVLATNTTFTVASGTLALPGSSSSYFGDCFFSVANGATLDLVPNDQDVNAYGNFNGSGAGTVLLSTGRLHAGQGGLTLNLPGSLFQWSGGSIQVSSSAPFTNAGTINLSGGNISGASFF